MAEATRPTQSGAPVGVFRTSGGETRPAGRLVRRYRRGVRLAAGVLACLAGLVLCEFALRLSAPDEGLLLVNGFYLADHELGVRLQPNFRGGEISINSLGMRGPERARAKPPGARRILVLGDSFAFGVEPDQALTFPAVLERRLARKLPGVEVLNAGVPTWGTVQEARWLEREGLALQPDFVLVALYMGNDIVDDAAREPLYTAVDGYIAPARYAHSIWSLRMRLEALLHRLRIYRALRYRSAAGWTASHGLEQLFTDAVAGHSGELEELRLDLHRIQPRRLEILEEGWRRTFEALERIRCLTRAAGIPMSVVLIPDDLQINPHWRIAMKTLGYRAKDFDFERANRRLADFCASRGIPVLDLSQALAPQYQRGSRPYGPTGTKFGGHFNARGDRIAGAEIDRFLRRSGLSDFPSKNGLKGR